MHSIHRFWMVLAFALGLTACGPETEAGAPAEAELLETDPVVEEPAPAVPVVDEPLDLPRVEEPVCQPGPECEGIALAGGLTQHPILFAHGMGGFDQSLGILEYWTDVKGTLREAGYSVYVSVVDPLNGSDIRGQQLAANLDHVLACSCADKVNIIAHSQGGIDARYLINVLGYGDKVESITTIATPHTGSPVGDLILALTPQQADQILDLLGWMLTELYTDPKEDTALRSSLTWLSESHLTQFAKDFPTDFDAHAWYSYGGRAGLFSLGLPECEDAALPNPAEKTPLSAFMLAGYTSLGGLLGNDNDGLVTVKSAMYGNFRGCIPADHMQQIGLGVPQSWDHVGFYLEHAAFLVSAGH